VDLQIFPSFPGILRSISKFLLLSGGMNRMTGAIQVI